jgi:hypothetical protein
MHDRFLGSTDESLSRINAGDTLLERSKLWIEEDEAGMSI